MYMGSSSSFRVLRGNPEEGGEKSKLKAARLQLVLELQLGFVFLFLSAFTFSLLSTATSAYLMKVKVLVTQLCLDSLRGHGLWPPGSSVHGILQARVLAWVAISFSRGLPNPGIEYLSSALQAYSLLSEPPGKSPKHGTL